jgi:hypothetical protein
MKRLQRLRSTNPALETLAALTIDKGITGELEVIQAAKDIFAATGDVAVYNYTFLRLNIKRLWKLKKMKYETGVYKGKRIFSSRDSTKHCVAVLKEQDYNIKFPNNLDFIHNLLKEHKITKFSEFHSILTERSPAYFGTYAQMQIDAMIEYGHLGE